jgi:hypothetical protein
MELKFILGQRIGQVNPSPYLLTQNYPLCLLAPSVPRLPSRLLS